MRATLLIIATGIMFDRRAGIEQIVGAIEAVLGDAKRPVALHEPEFSGNEWRYVKECLDTGWVSSVGSYVDRFERDIGDYIGGYAVATVNGTAALEIAMRLAGVRSGDEVLVPALTFIATANAVSYCGALPHLVDSCEKSLGLDPASLVDYLGDIAEVTGDRCVNRHTGRRISAVVAMHTFGIPVDMNPLVDLAARYRLSLVEDAAESLGSTYRGRPTGSIGDIGALSFNGNKIMTTGGGGAVISRDKAVAVRAKHLTTTARVPHRWNFMHDEVGYNYRMPNINAALGCAQLEQTSKWVERKRALATQYYEAFANVSGVRIAVEPDYACSNYWLNTLLLDRPSLEFRDAILEATNSRQIQTRPVWTLLNRLPMYADCPSMPLSGAVALEQRIVSLPSSPRLAA